jgi:hypothetical protein
VDGIRVSIDQTFSDIADDSDSILGFMGSLNIVSDRFVGQINTALVRVEGTNVRARAPASSGVPVSVSLETDIISEAVWVEGFAGYRVLDRRFGEANRDRFTLDAFVGLRVTSVDIRVDATAELEVELPSERTLEGGVRESIDESHIWLEHFVGMRTGVEFGEHWSAMIRGDVGGFGMTDSRFAWQVLGGVVYRWEREGWTCSVFGGYRALGQEYENNGFVWDTVTHGPIIGLSIAFEF